MRSQRRRECVLVKNYEKNVEYHITVLLHYRKLIMPLDTKFFGSFRILIPNSYFPPSRRRANRRTRVLEVVGRPSPQVALGPTGGRALLQLARDKVAQGLLSHFVVVGHASRRGRGVGYRYLNLGARTGVRLLV